MVKIKYNGKYHITLSEEAMDALVSMVRLEMAHGWVDMQDDIHAEAAEKLLAAINANF